MKRILYICALVLLFQSCKKEVFDYENYQPKVSDIDHVAFYTGSPTLIADGKAELSLILEAYRTVQVKDEDGAMVSKKMLVDYKDLPENEVKIFLDGKEFKGTKFSTTDATKSTLEFYAQIGLIKTPVKTVVLLPKPAPTEKRYVDVVFHVFELSSADEGYDPLIYQPIEQKHLKEAIAYANSVFNNEYGKDPNGGVANIEFRLATKNSAGLNLAQPGYNLITYNSTWKSSPTATSFIPANFTDRINSTANYKWNKDQYLNIYILPFAGNTSIGNNRAGYQIAYPGKSTLEGINVVVASEDEVPQTDFYTTYGLGIPRTMFFPGSDRKIEIASFLGTYYGLYPAYSSSTTETTVLDYVHDTRKYLTGSNQKQNTVSNLLKTDVNGEKFLANNAMDELRFASLRNSFTLGQVERMRLVMERSPVRKAWSQQ